MAVETAGQIISLPTTQNLTSTASLFKPMFINAGGNAVLAVTSSMTILGILQNQPASTNGGQCSIMVNGVSKIQRAAATPAIGEGAPLVVGTTAGGTIGTTAKGYIFGRALTPATTFACIFTALIRPEGSCSTVQGITVAPS